MLQVFMLLSLRHFIKSISPVLSVFTTQFLYGFNSEETNGAAAWLFLKTQIIFSNSVFKFSIIFLSLFTSLSVLKDKASVNNSRCSISANLFPLEPAFFHSFRDGNIVLIFGYGKVLQHQGKKICPRFFKIS